MHKKDTLSPSPYPPALSLVPCPFGTTGTNKYIYTIYKKRTYATSSTICLCSVKPSAAPRPCIVLRRSGQCSSSHKIPICFLHI